MNDLQPHIQLSKDLNVSKAILVGDPARLDRLKELLKDSREIKYNREYRSILGFYNDTLILGISTGIGAPSTAIAVEELYQIGIKEMIRVGSAGAYQSNIDLGQLIIGTGCVRDDGVTSKYAPISLPCIPSLSMLIKAKSIAFDAHYGYIRSHDGFYMNDNHIIEKKWSEFGILGADMESGTVLTLAYLRGIKALSILNNVVLWGEDTKDGINDLVNGEQKVKNGELKSLEVALKILVD